MVDTEDYQLTLYGYTNVRNGSTDGVEAIFTFCLKVYWLRITIGPMLDYHIVSFIYIWYYLMLTHLLFGIAQMLSIVRTFNQFL
jgi:hypothetical protein